MVGNLWDQIRISQKKCSRSDAKGNVRNALSFPNMSLHESIPSFPMLSDRQELCHVMDEYLRTMWMIPINTLKPHFVFQHLNRALGFSLFGIRATSIRALISHLAPRAFLLLSPHESGIKSLNNSMLSRAIYYLHTHDFWPVHTWSDLVRGQT